MNIYLARVLLKDKKVSLLVEGVDEQSVKTSLRAQGYSVVEVRLSDEEEGREFFFFQASDESGATQEGKIESTDIFSAYKKLVDELGYKVIKIHTEAQTDAEEQQETTQNIQKLYEISLLEKKDKFTKKKKEKDALSSKKVAAAQTLLIKAEDIVLDSKETFHDDDLNKLLEPHETEIKMAKSISNIAKIEETIQEPLTLIGEHISKAGHAAGPSKSMLSRINKLLRKTGMNRRYAIEVKKGPSPTTVHLQKGKKLLDNLMVGTKKPFEKKDEFTRLKEAQARKKYLAEMKNIIKKPTQPGIGTNILRLRAIEERLIETSGKSSFLGLVVKIINTICIAVIFALVFFGLLLAAFMGQKVSYGFIFFIAVIHMLSFVFVLHATRKILVVGVLASILLGALAPNL